MFENFMANLNNIIQVKIIIDFFFICIYANYLQIKIISDYYYSLKIIFLMLKMYVLFQNFTQDKKIKSYFLLIEFMGSVNN